MAVDGPPALCHEEAMARLPPGLALAPDGRPRCAWALSAPDYLAYHDEEWGRPVGDDRRLFEKLCLEGFQAGLSWLTILRKRERFREVFDGFEPERVARLGPRDVARLLRDPGIVRHRGKIEAAIANAHRALALVEEAGSLAAFVWGFEPAPGDRPRRISWGAVRAMATTPASIALSKALKARGWRFVGPTTVQAFLQAMGVVNDHVEGCAVRGACQAARDRFRRPGR
jgi:DNA-3-methyladenine glycosylase I